MLDFQQRVVDEKSELDSKLIKLDSFINHNNAIFNNLPVDEQIRLKFQLRIMQDYSSVLTARIQHFSY